MDKQQRLGLGRERPRVAQKIVRYARHRLYYKPHSSSKKHLHLGTWGSLLEVREMAAASLWMC